MNSPETQGGRLENPAFSGGPTADALCAPAAGASSPLSDASGQSGADEGLSAWENGWKAADGAADHPGTSEGGCTRGRGMVQGGRGWMD